MPRDGARTFGDLIGRLDHLEIVCPKCDRLGRYLVHRLAMQHGPDFKLPDWIALMTRDCPRRRSPGLADACAAQCPACLASRLKMRARPRQDRAMAVAAGAGRFKIDR